jgi:hypothetical protein
MPYSTCGVVGSDSDVCEAARSPFAGIGLDVDSA